MWKFHLVYRHTANIQKSTFSTIIEIFVQIKSTISLRIYWTYFLIEIRPQYTQMNHIKVVGMMNFGFKCRPKKKIHQLCENFIWYIITVEPFKNQLFRLFFWIFVQIKLSICLRIYWKYFLIKIRPQYSQMDQIKVVRMMNLNYKCCPKKEID